jgi:hypothetical protein
MVKGDDVAIGIDPGKEGAIAFVMEGRVMVFDASDVKGISYLREMLGYMEIMSQPGKVVAVLEKVGPRRHMRKVKGVLRPVAEGTVSCFNFGASFGYWKGVLDMAQIPYHLIAPTKWQAGVRDSTKAEKGKIKEWSLKRARQIFPSMETMLTRKKDNGRSDALLIAEYCSRTFF